jgi:hypothetical protein
VLGNSSDNARAVDRKALESRVLTELCERMMTPEIAAERVRRKSIGSTANAEAHRNPPAASFPKPRKPSRRSCASSSKAVGIAPCPTG